MPDFKKIAAIIDHTLLKPGMLVADVNRLCQEAIQHGFAAVCVPPPFIKQARQLLLQSERVKLATVIGFPFGYSAVEAKLAESLLAIVDGADELDVVINFTAIKNNDWQYVANEINNLIPTIKNNGKIIKVIIESGLLTNEEIIKCCQLYSAAGVDFVKTSTGYAEKGASVEHVKLIASHLGAHVRIKASGGIKTAAFANELMSAGASRIGCSSGVAIVSGTDSNEKY